MTPRTLAPMPREWAIRPESLEAIVARHDAGVTVPRGTGPGCHDHWYEHGPGHDDDADDDHDCERHGAVVRDGVARIQICGVLMRAPDFLDCFFGGAGSTYPRIAAAVRAAVLDPRVRAIVLDVDSPGGETAGVHDAAEAILAARSVKPVVAYTSGVMASAAYWLGSAASRVVLAPSAIVGSVGTIVCTYDDTAAMERAGVRRVVIRSSQTPRKALRVEDEGGVAEWQAVLDRISDAFAMALVRHRGAGAEGLMQRLEGRVLVGSDCVAAGLADAVAGDADAWLVHGGPPPGSLFAGRDGDHTESPDVPAVPRDPFVPVPYTTPGASRATQEQQTLAENTVPSVAPDAKAAAGPLPVPDVVGGVPADVSALRAQLDTANANERAARQQVTDLSARLASTQADALTQAKAAADARAAADAAKAQADELAQQVRAHGEQLADMREREPVAARDAMLDRHQQKRGVITPATRATWSADADRLGVETVDAMLDRFPAGSARPVAVVGHGGGGPTVTGEPKNQQDLAHLARAAVERKEHPTFGAALRALCEIHPEAAAVSGLRSAEA